MGQRRMPFGVTPVPEVALHGGAGCFVYADGVGQVRRTMRIYYASPQADVRDAPIVIAMHGVNRAAAEFRDSMAAQCTRNGQIVLVPEFDTGQFPDVHAYNFGGVRRPPPGNTVLPREQWNFGLLDRVFEYVRDAIGSSTLQVHSSHCAPSHLLRLLPLTLPSQQTVVPICCQISPPSIRSAWEASISMTDICEGILGVAW